MLVSSPPIQVTGQLGEVMRESTKIAYTLARNFLNTRIIGHRDNAFLATQQVGGCVVCRR